MPNVTPILVTTTNPGSSGFLQQAAAGISYTITTGLVSITANQHRRILIQNPYASGVNINIYSIVNADDSLGLQTTKLYIDPQTPLPKLANKPIAQNLLIDAAGDTDLSIISFSWDVSSSGFTGGEQNTSLIHIGGENSKIDATTLILEQGATIGLDTVYANAQTTSFTMYWFEQTATETNQPTQTGTPLGLLLAITRLGP
jgi:hypothetical protein